MAVRETSRRETIDHLSVALVQNAALLSRLIFRHARPGVTRSEGSMLATLESGPQRITDLAELEGLAQPTVTLLVKRLEERGWVARGRTSGDGRVVMVSLTGSGELVLQEARSRYQDLLSACLSELTDERILELGAAADALGTLIDALQEEKGQ